MMATQRRQTVNSLVAGFWQTILRLPSVVGTVELLSWLRPPLKPGASPG